MRLTPEILLRIARETAIKRSLSDPGLVAVYLTGSLLTESPFLGGAADIDLVCVHAQPVKIRREFLAITPEVHLDLVHRPRAEYEKPKELRLNPWLGPELYDARPLYNSQHFFEFVQAGVRDRYLDPGSVLARAAPLPAEARRLWTGLQSATQEEPERLRTYLEAVGLAAQGLALLNGGPLPDRRLLLSFPARAEAAGVPGLAVGLAGLLGGARAEAGRLKAWLPAWEQAFSAAAGRPRVEGRIAAARLVYYREALETLIEGGNPLAALWPLLLTWTLAAAGLPAGRQAGWREACTGLGLAGPDFTERIQALDAFLDAVEETLEAFAHRQGLESGQI